MMCPFMLKRAVINTLAQQVHQVFPDRCHHGTAMSQGLNASGTEFLTEVTILILLSIRWWRSCIAQGQMVSFTEHVALAKIAAYTKLALYSICTAFAEDAKLGAYATFTVPAPSGPLLDQSFGSFNGLASQKGSKLD